MFFHRNDNDDQNPGAGAPSGETFPLLPLRDIIVFPHMVVPLFVGREKSINALEEAMSQDKEILLAAQKKAKTNDPTAEDIFEVGTVGTIIQLLRLPDGTVKVLVEGKRRARITEFLPNDDFFLSAVEPVEEVFAANVEIEALIRSVQSAFDVYAKLNKKVQPEVVMSVEGIDDPSKLADTIAANLPTIKLSERYALLSMSDVKARLERLYQLMQSEIEILQVENAKDLAMVLAAVGLAQNMGALHALASEGIQRGHMSLHARSLALAAGAESSAEVDAVAAGLVAQGEVKASAAATILQALREGR